MPPKLEPAILMGSRFYFGMSAGDIHALFSRMKVYNRRLFFLVLQWYFCSLEHNRQSEVYCSFLGRDMFF